MNFTELLHQRKSIRSYTGEKISQEELEQILDAAYASPVGRGSYETYQINVITDPEILAAIEVAGNERKGTPDGHPLYGAPMLVLVSAPLAGIPADNVPYSSAAILVNNMALKAEEMGIGSCLIWGCIAALAAHPETVEKMNLPEGHKPCCGVALGYSELNYEEREIAKGKIATAYLK